MQYLLGGHRFNELNQTYFTELSFLDLQVWLTLLMSLLASAIPSLLAYLGGTITLTPITICYGYLRRLKRCLHSRPIPRTYIDQQIQSGFKILSRLQEREKGHYKCKTESNFKKVQTPQQSMFRDTFLENCSKKYTQICF